MCAQLLRSVLLFVTLPGSSICGIIQARILEWVAISLIYTYIIII